MIRVRDLSLRYGNKLILDRFSIDLELEGTTCLKGPSGCGKTTLLRAIAGLEKPRSGEISGVPDKVAFMFQEDRLLMGISALENVAAVLPKGERKRAVDFLSLVELEAEANTPPLKLSGGMRRRVALARCLAFGGGLFILDEPFKGMDSSLISRLSVRIKAAGIPVLAAVHASEELDALGGRVIELEGPPLRIME